MEVLVLVATKGYLFILANSPVSGVKSEVRTPLLDVSTTSQSALYSSTPDTYEKEYSQAYTTAHQYYNR